MEAKGGAPKGAPKETPRGHDGRGTSTCAPRDAYQPGERRQPHSPERRSGGTYPIPPGTAASPAQEKTAHGLAETARPFASRTQPLFGQYLVKAGHISESALAAALQAQKKSHARLGETLIASGAIRALDLYRALGRQLGLPFVNLLEEPPEPALLKADELDFYLTHRCLPWRVLNGQEIFVASDPAAARRALEEAQRPALVFLTSPLDILWSLQKRFRHHLTHRARFALAKEAAHLSARKLVTPALKGSTFCLAAFCLAALFFFGPAMLGLINLIAGSTFLALAALRAFSLLYGVIPLKAPRERRREDALPVYTILVPLFREAAIIPGLAKALRALDYPPDKLDIKFVLEEGDSETLEAAKAARLPSHVEFIIVPKSKPLTKPKACNYALAFARGEFLVVYDAEDVPDPRQLRMALAAFDEGGPRMACVQGQLMFYNARENWLTRQSAIEYAALFELLLPALARFGLPFPLGGTSTHFRTALLRRTGAWDPFNVTEDADLGLRLHELGFRTAVIPSLTQEEATLTPAAWMRQRTRWLKGWMQTLLVRLRAPWRTARQLRPAAFVFSYVVLGGFVLAALLHPFIYLMALHWLLSGTGSMLAADPFAPFNLSVFAMGYGVTLAASAIAARQRFGLALACHVALSPLYWLMISAAAYRALWQLARQPDYWEKTEHGLSRLRPKEKP